MRTIILISAAFGALLMFPSIAQSFVDSSTASSESGQAAAFDNEQRPAASSSSSVLGSVPARGMTMKQVERDFGVPSQRRAPVGNPPISRWEYQDFIVYFEYRHVIHSVAQRP